MNCQIPGQIQHFEEGVYINDKLSDYMEEGVPNQEINYIPNLELNENDITDNQSGDQIEGVYPVENNQVAIIPEIIPVEGMPNSICHKLKNRCIDPLINYTFMCYEYCANDFKSEDIPPLIAGFIFFSALFGIILFGIFCVLVSPFFILIILYAINPKLNQLNGERKCCAFVSSKIPDEYLYCLSDNFVYCHGPDYTKQSELNQLYELQLWLYIGYFVLGIISSLLYISTIWLIITEIVRYIKSINRNR